MSTEALRNLLQTDSRFGMHLYSLPGERPVKVLFRDTNQVKFDASRAETKVPWKAPPSLLPFLPRTMYLVPLPPQLKSYWWAFSVVMNCARGRKARTQQRGLLQK